MLRGSWDGEGVGCDKAATLVRVRLRRGTDIFDGKSGHLFNYTPGNL